MQRAVGRRLLGKHLILAKQSAVLSEEAARLIGHEDRAPIASGLDAKERIKQPSSIDHMDFGLLALRAEQRRQEAKASPASNWIGCDPLIRADSRDSGREWGGRYLTDF